MGEAQRHHAKWRKSDSVGYGLYEAISMIFWKRQDYRDRKQISGCQGLEEGGPDHQGGMSARVGGARAGVAQSL